MVRIAVDDPHQVDLVHVNEVAVRAAGLSKRYPNGAEALRAVSFTVDRGQMVAVLGPSGSGKTTLFRLCNGSARSTNGRIDVLGVPMEAARAGRLRDLRKRVAVVYQNHNLVSSVSVLQNVLMGRLGHVSLPRAIRSALLPAGDDLRAVEQVLGALGIADKLLSRADDLSGGQQQRVAVARALLQRPELLLADEPVASVDAETAEVILDLLARLCHEEGVTVLISLHQREYVERYCDRLIELHSGELVRDESIEGVFPRERLVAP
jgi:phosphonate transport system ATP-binding protein